MALSPTSTHPPMRAFAPLSVIQVAGDHLCSYCLQPKHAITAGLQKCSACKRVAYCSTTCQKSDWRIYHKHFCPQFQKVNKYDRDVVGDRPLSLRELIQTQQMRIQILAKGNQHGENDPCNRQFIQHENICHVCYRTPFQKAEYRPFPTCQKCNLGRWCSNECKATFDSIHTMEDCTDLRLFGAVERVEIDYAVARKSKRQLMIRSQTPRKPGSYIPLSQIADWDDYHRRIFPDFGFAYDFTAREFKSSHPDAIQAVKMMAMEATCVPLTVIAALEAAGLATRDTLSIHFVGAASREFSAQGMMEELLHYLPTLKKLHICYIGPEVDDDLNQLAGAGKNLACASCQRARCTRTCSYYNTEYHTLMKASGPKQADLIVGLNTGMTEVSPESWKKTLEYILKKGIPAAFTAYSKVEAQLEDRMLRGMGAQFLVNIQENKWRGVIPTLNMMQKLVAEGKDANRLVGMSYNCNYWYVFRG